MYKTEVVGYTPKAKNMAKKIEKNATKWKKCDFLIIFLITFLLFLPCYRLL